MANILPPVLKAEYDNDDFEEDYITILQKYDCNINLLPDLSRIKLKDFALEPNSPVKQVSISIENGNIEPEYVINFDKTGKLTGFYDSWDGEETTQLIKYDNSGKVKFIKTKHLFDRDDYRTDPIFVEFEIVRDNNGISEIIEYKADRNYNHLYGKKLHHKIVKDYSGKIVRMECEEYPDIYWTIDKGYSFKESYGDAYDDSYYQGSKIWDSSLCDFYIDQSKENINFKTDPYLNWNKIEWEEELGEYTDYNHMTRDIEYYGDEFKGTLRGVLDWDKTCLADFFYSMNSGIKKITVVSNSAEDGGGYIYEFNKEGRVIKKTFFDDLDDVLDETFYQYDQLGNLIRTINNYMPNIISEEISEYNEKNHDFDIIGYDYISEPVVTVQTDFIWEYNQLKEISEKITSINFMPVEYPTIHYTPKYSKNGNISEIICKENPMIYVRYTPEGYIKSDAGYVCKYDDESKDKVTREVDVTYIKYPIRGCDINEMKVPKGNLEYIWTLNCQNFTDKSGLPLNGNPNWDYRLAPYGDDITIDERDSRGNWTIISWDIEGLYRWSMEAEIEYFENL